MRWINCITVVKIYEPQVKRGWDSRRKWTYLDSPPFAHSLAKRSGSLRVSHSPLPMFSLIQILMLSRLTSNPENLKPFFSKKPE